MFPIQCIENDIEPKSNQTKSPPPQTKTKKKKEKNSHFTLIASKVLQC